ncbi:hypothetical protein LIER_21795 [Lithospermum erythrorhizon]|uniref:BHLH domain-containing protein n=1 Tax=Lithospermum erythrorhizon TaxID=34254 RepID=A0AAV3QRG9_LITER
MFGPRPEQCIGPECSSSFTALLELPPNQAVELLFHTPADFETPPPENSPENSCSKEVKKEDGVYSDCKMSLSPEISHTNKRKGRDKKAKETNKKNKKNTKESCEDEKLPYVHVRARRGQATDSHSIAERARREKINARMKLLQELVPGCNKISGTAYVLDEIINHVQSLQHHVEFLSMRLAAVSPGIDINTDTFMTAENGSLVGSNHPGITTPVLWPEEQIRPQYQQLWQLDGFQQPVWVKEEDKSNFVAPETSLLNYDSLGNSDLQKNCLKMQF